jgi:uncharacterized Zn finger protein
VLGAAGLDAYRDLVDPRWQALISQTDDWSSARFRLREARIGVALASSDPDELIEVRRTDLRVPDDYLEVARMLAEHGRHEEAVDWARRGLERFADRSWQTPPLREFLAGVLREGDETVRAVELFWEAFDQSPTLAAYRRLLEEAGEDAATWRGRALRRLRAALPAEARPPARPSGRAPSDVLVEILAHEGDTDAAWEVATRHGCDERLRLALAREREASHPLDAIEVYAREIFAQIDRKKNPAYRAAVDLLSRVRRLAQQAGRPERFDELLQRARTEHKAKRNLQALLDRRGW